MCFGSFTITGRVNFPDFEPGPLLDVLKFYAVIFQIGPWLDQCQLLKTPLDASHFTVYLSDKMSLHTGIGYPGVTGNFFVQG